MLKTDRKKSRRDMGELAGGSGRWWRSVRRSHGDLHHRDVAHNVIIKSLCIEGFSCLEVIRSPQEVCVVPIKGQTNKNTFEINLSNAAEHENISTLF